MAAPRIYPPKDAAKKIHQLASDGKTKAGIARAMNVSTPTLNRWMDEDELLRDAFDQGRDEDREYLEALLRNAAANGEVKAQSNVMFILKCRHGYREFDQPTSKVDVGVQVKTPPVMVVRDHGSNEEWAAKVAAQQAKLITDVTDMHPAPALQAPKIELPIIEAEIVEVKPVPAPSWTPPSWKPRS